MTDEELKEAAASTTYMSSLKECLKQAKSESTKAFIQQCIDYLRRSGKLE